MNYEIKVNDRVIQLPKYSFDIADALETQENINAGSDSLFTKCKSMYSLFCKLLTEDVTKEILGDFEKCDPNEINLLYLGIINAYNSPLTEQQVQQNNNKLDRIGESMSKIDRMMQTLEAVEKMSR